MLSGAKDLIRRERVVVMLIRSRLIRSFAPLSMTEICSPTHPKKWPT